MSTEIKAALQHAAWKLRDAKDWGNGYLTAEQLLSLERHAEECEAAVRELSAPPSSAPEKSLALCSGCRDNFYNGNNPHGVKRCWSFDKAMVEKRIKIPIQMRPPYKMPANWTLSCHKPDGYVQVKPEALTADGFWKS